MSDYGCMGLPKAMNKVVSAERQVDRLVLHILSLLKYGCMDTQEAWIQKGKLHFYTRLCVTMSVLPSEFQLGRWATHCNRSPLLGQRVRQTASLPTAAKE